MSSIGTAWDLPLSLLLFLSAQSAVYSMNLELASVVFRHGDRSPVYAFPKKWCDECYWPQGLGQLSIKGQVQEYSLGRVLQQRYVESDDLIYPNYTRVQVYVRSTDVDRTLMSVQCQLAALFPPNKNETFNETIPWQPIPVHTVPQEDDRLLRGYDVDCPRYKALREEDKRSKEYKKIEEENKSFLARMQEETGLVPTTLDNVWQIQDTLLVQKDTFNQLPPWIKPGDFQKLTNLSTYTFNLMFSSTEKSRLAAGNWVSKVVSDMKSKRDNPKSDIKLNLYSAHDTTVVNMLAALNVYDGTLPGYAAALFVELYSDGGEYFVSLFYCNGIFNNIDEECLPKPLPVAACENSTLCTLDEFIEYTKPVIPEDWEKECGLSTGSSGDSTVNIVAVVVLGVLLGVVTTALIVMTVLLLVACRKKRTKKIPFNVQGQLLENEESFST